MVDSVIDSSFLSRLLRSLGITRRGAGADPSKPAGDPGDEFLDSSDPRNVTAKGLLGAAQSLIAGISGANKNINPSNIAQISKWEGIHSIALRLMTIVEQIMQLATGGSPIKSNAISLKTIASAAVSESQANISFHKDAKKEDIKASKDAGQHTKSAS